MSKYDLWQLFYTENKFTKYIKYNDLRAKSAEYTKSNVCTYTNHGKDYCDLLVKCEFVEISSSITGHFFNLQKERALNKEYSWPLKIMVLDERIQAFSEQEKYSIEKPTGGCQQKLMDKTCFHSDGVPYSELYKNTNILVPHISDECNLNEQNFHDQTHPEYQKIINYIQNEFVLWDEQKKAVNSKCEFLVIHLGIIEKLIIAWNSSNAGKEYNKEITADVAEFLKNVILNLDLTEEEMKAPHPIYDKVIVTSGRGKPHNLPVDVRYINFSVISQYMITLRNKYALTESLYCARKSI